MEIMRSIFLIGSFFALYYGWLSYDTFNNMFSNLLVAELLKIIPFGFAIALFLRLQTNSAG